MALSTLFNGSDCGPTNPLSSLAKQFDTNHGIQRDLFGPGQASNIKQPFRTQAVANSTAQDAARFFSDERTAQPITQYPANPLNLDPLKFNLPSVDYTPKPIAGPSFAMMSSWSSEFMKQESFHTQEIETGIKSKAPPRQLTNIQYFSPIGIRQGFPTSNIHQPQGLRFDESARKPPFLLEVANFEQAEVAANEVAIPIDSDELSKTAGLLIDAVKQESNPKFKNSAFLSLMRQLRDREITIQGSDVIQSNASDLKQFTADVKGKGKAVEVLQRANVVNGRREVSGLNNVHSSSAGLFSSPKQMPSVEKSSDTVPLDIEVETDEDRFWRTENDAYKQYWSHSLSQPGSYHHSEWDKLQTDWDKFEATSTGITAVSNYPFQINNSYTRRSHSGNFMSGTPDKQSFQSLLELEAAVQNNLHDPIGWFRLGVKQQENERERHAILALQRATELDPSYLEAWLALAISYTNEGDKSGAFSAIRSWLNHNRKYKHAVSFSSDSSDGQKDEKLTQQLMSLIRQTSEKEIDADLQTALGVVLNTSEGFERAQDCFQTALSVRPNDWLLYNRVGATLANSGRAKDALWYYYQALALNPSYIRARFNLGIAYINMKQYDEAAQHILDALVLQENDTSSGDTRGVTSSALWECLRNTCLQLQRNDLATLCGERNLEGFRQAFSN